MWTSWATSAKAVMPSEGKTSSRTTGNTGAAVALRSWTATTPPPGTLTANGRTATSSTALTRIARCRRNECPNRRSLSGLTRCLR